MTPTFVQAYLITGNYWWLVAFDLLAIAAVVFAGWLEVKETR